jgi:hypothetical protein
MSANKNWTPELNNIETDVVIPKHEDAALMLLHRLIFATLLRAPLTCQMKLACRLLLFGVDEPLSIRSTLSLGSRTLVITSTQNCLHISPIRFRHNLLNTDLLVDKGGLR